MANIKGLNAVVNALGKRRKQSKRENNGDVIVGYTAEYAVYVHEDMEARHAPGKQAKFLHQPAVELQKELATIILTAKRLGIPLMQAIYMAGLRLQAESQRICPVSGWHEKISPKRQGSGNLKGSAFTRIEK